MKNINLYKMFTENRLVMQGPSSAPKRSAADENRDFLDSIVNPSAQPKQNPVNATQAKGLVDIKKMQDSADESARKNSVERNTKEIFQFIKQIEGARSNFTKLANASKNPVAQRVAMDHLLNYADAVGARGTGKHKIQRPSIQQGSDLDAMVSAVMENLLYKEFRISDVSDAKQFDNIEITLDKVSRHRVDRYAIDPDTFEQTTVVMGSGPDLGAVSNVRNKFASFTNVVNRMKGEFSR